VRGTIKKVIIATDRSEASDGAAEVGIDLARESGSRAAAVYVVDVTRLTHLHGYASFLGIKDSLLRDMLEEGSKATGHVEKLAEEVQVPLRKIILPGDQSAELLRISNESPGSVLARGRVGRSGLKKFLIGSVADKVVRHAKVPIQMVPGIGD
jgi:nucleotide-binding universal stress UspA family protein